MSGLRAWIIRIAPPPPPPPPALHPTDQGWYHSEGSAMFFSAIVPRGTPLAPDDLLKVSVAAVVKIYVQARGAVVRRMD